jgi:phytoene dehydrogenase-like protein
MGNLAGALAGFIESRGGEIRTRAQVSRIVVEDARAVAVELAGGQRIDGVGLVASSAHPRQLVLDLLPRECVSDELTCQMRHYELGQSVMTVYLALDSPVDFTAGAPAGESVYVHPSPPTLDYFARVFYQARSGLLPDEPFALVCNDSVADASRVPSGRALMKLVVQPVPYVIEGDAGGTIEATDWADAKELFADRVVDLLARHYIPDLTDKIVKRVVCSPVDLEQTLPSAIHGTNDHGAMVPYQAGAMRPTPEMGQYKSPVANVYLCGAGSHPGPGVTLAPGRNAAQAICRDLA